jgi:hypothetical protein
MDAQMPSRVVAMGQNYRYKETHEVPDTVNAVLEYPEGFAVNLSSTFNNQASAESGFEVLGTEAALVMRGDQMVLKPETATEDNGWVVSSWAEGLEKAYYADPKVIASEVRGSWTPRMRKGETSAKWAGSATYVHMSRLRVRGPASRRGGRPDGHRAAAAAHMVNQPSGSGAHGLERHHWRGARPGSRGCVPALLIHRRVRRGEKPTGDGPLGHRGRHPALIVTTGTADALWGSAGADAGAQASARAAASSAAFRRAPQILPAVSRHQVPGTPKGARKDLRHLPEALVAREMAVRVVERLEEIEVEEDQREGRARATAPTPLDREHLIEPAAVRHSGQRIEGR